MVANKNSLLEAAPFWELSPTLCDDLFPFFIQVSAQVYNTEMWAYKWIKENTSDFVK